MRTICTFGLPIYVSMDWLLFWKTGEWILFMERLKDTNEIFKFFLKSWLDLIEIQPLMFFTSYDDDFVNCLKADFCVRCVFGSNVLNGVQLVPQGFFRWIGLQLDYIERWVFPVFKPTYGLSKAVAADYCFPPLHLHFSTFSQKKLFFSFISPGRQSKCRGRFWPGPLESEANANFKRHAWLDAVYFPWSLTIWATPTDLWLEGTFVPLLLH